MKSNRRRWLLLVVALLIVTAIALAILSQTSPSPQLPPVTILSEPYVIPITPRDRLALTFPNSRFVNRLENAFFGPRKPLTIRSKVFSCTANQTEGVDPLLSIGEPAYTNSTGLRIWIPDRPTFEKSGPAIFALPEAKILAGPGIGTAEGIGASFFVGQEVPLNGVTNSVGISMQCIAHIEDHLVDLVTTVTDSELQTNLLATASTNSLSIQTNLNVRARIEVPKGHGIFLIQSNGKGPNQKLSGILIDPLQ